MSRIESDKINYGNSFVIRAEGETVLNKEISEAKNIAEKLVAEAKRQAESILAQAKQQTEIILNNAVQEAESAKEEVTSEFRRQGYEEGYEDGKEKITTELENLVYNVNNFAKAKFEMKNRIIKSLHLDILDLVTNIAQKVCKTELSINNKVLTKLVANAISHLKEKENVTIIVHPEMAQKLYDISDELKSSIHSLENIRIIEDASVSPDGTIVESVGSRVDARVSAQIELIAQKLITELNSTPEIELAREIDDTYDKPDEI